MDDEKIYMICAWFDRHLRDVAVWMSGLNVSDREVTVHDSVYTGGGGISVYKRMCNPSHLKKPQCTCFCSLVCVSYGKSSPELD